MAAEIVDEKNIFARSAPLVHRLPGVRFAQSESIQVADFISCYGLYGGYFEPDSGDSVFRRKLIAFHEADAAERDRKIEGWQRDAEQGDAVAQYFLAYIHSQGPTPNHALAYRWFRMAAEQAEAMPSDSGDMFEDGSAAQCCLADLYERGIGVTQSDAQAVLWYTRSATKGNYLAQYRLGIKYMDGQGIAQDMAKAQMWLAALAEGYGPSYYSTLATNTLLKFPTYRNAKNGDKEAQFEIARMYEAMPGYSEFKRRMCARDWYQKSAAQGHAEAQFRLGKLYMEGIFRADWAEAWAWLSKAAEQGHPQAIRILEEAAMNGDSRAQYSLGMMYRDGRGVPKDLKQARTWLSKSAEQGYDDARKALLELPDRPEHS